MSPSQGLTHSPLQAQVPLSGGTLDAVPPLLLSRWAQVTEGTGGAAVAAARVDEGAGLAGAQLVAQ